MSWRVSVFCSIFLLFNTDQLTDPPPHYDALTTVLHACRYAVAPSSLPFLITAAMELKTLRYSAFCLETSCEFAKCVALKQRLIRMYNFSLSHLIFLIFALIYLLHYTYTISNILSAYYQYNTCKIITQNQLMFFIITHFIITTN